MLDQNIFMETVREVSEIIRTSAVPLAREEILSYFKDMELNEEQQEMVFTYLITPHEEPEPEEVQKPEAEEPQSVFPDSPVFQMYMEELKSIPAYNKEEIEELYTRLLSGDQKAVKQLSDAWLGRVLKLAEELAISSENFEDIVQEGNMSLFLTLTTLCGSGSGRDVEQELVRAVEAAMQACISEYAGDNDNESAIVGRVNLVNEARKYLTEENGAVPTVNELADYTRMTPEELAEMLNIIENAQKGENK